LHTQTSRRSRVRFPTGPLNFLFLFDKLFSATVLSTVDHILIDN
jgi:hypothetical protein